MMPSVSLHAADQALRPVQDRGWRNGLANLLRRELQAWWGTRTWLVQSLIWSVLVNGLLAMTLWTGPRLAALEVAQTLLSILIGVFGALGVILATQGAIVAEKEQGTAGWVLSKPVSRVAFLAAKWIAHGLGFFVTMILLQGSIAYAQFAVAGAVPEILPFVAAMGLLSLQLLAYLTLTLMLGTFFGSQKGVAGIAALLLFVQPLLAEMYQFGVYLPGALPLQATDILRGGELPTIVPLIGTIVLTVVSGVVGIWRFQREEF